MTTPTISKYEAAVSAVLKLHAPEEWDSVFCSQESECKECHTESGAQGPGHAMLACTECVGVTDDGELGKVPYPCPTVRAIKVALAPRCPDEQSACSEYVELIGDPSTKLEESANSSTETASDLKSAEGAA